MAGDDRGPGPLIDVLPAVTFECELNGTALQLSQHWVELTGQPLNEALGEGWLSHFDAASRAVAIASFAEALNSSEPVHFFLHGRLKGGIWSWFRVAVRMNKERPTLVGVALPIPGDEQPDEYRARLEQLEQIAARAEALLEASPDLTLHMSYDGRFLGYRAPEMSQLYRPPESFLGKHLAEVMPDEIARAGMEAMRVARLNNIHQNFEYSLTDNNETREFEARTVPMKNGDFLIVVRDITDQRIAERAMVSAREEALERSRVKTLFLANVSHEIRTPLNGILGVTELLKHHALPAEFNEYVEVLSSAGESLLAIVNDVLDLSKIEANRLELEVRVFDLEQVVRESAKSFFAQVQKKGIALTVDFSPEAQGPVRGDVTRVRQLVNNLIGNAVKFTDKGGVRVEVKRPAGDTIHLHVIDTGTGIAAENQARIFEAFEQENSGVQRRFGGTGLGLAIARRIARLMGGDVSVRSEPGKGSTFELSVRLPPVVISSPVNARPLERPDIKPLRVLLAEDDVVNASMTAALLRKLGHEVMVVNDGYAAVTAISANAHDVVFMDVHMPVMDGLEATRAIREMEKTTKRHLPIVALTANALKGDDLLCLSAGMDAYLPKPVTVGALKDLLSWFSGGAT